MSWTIKTVPAFDREAKKLAKKHNSLRTDLKNLQEELMSNPFSGIEILPGIRKIRIAIASKGKGKSGGARVIYFITTHKSDTGEIILLYIYDKSDSSNIRTDYLRQLLKDLNLDNIV